ncbi:hypothetical protein [Paenibacillus mesophilus]|uniref:hypothetical protein n=1 Tax=Paenibacillus mesophilus TaxID=2582849 RepID=UPI0013053B48|nr:hypothetical protein [Paenibacillus mesophilus]
MKRYSKLLLILLMLGMAVYAGIAAFAAEDGSAAGHDNGLNTTFTHGGLAPFSTHT